MGEPKWQHVVADKMTPLLYDSRIKQNSLNVLETECSFQQLTHKVVPTSATLSVNHDTQCLCWFVSIKDVSVLHINQAHFDWIVDPAIDLWPEALDCMVL